MKLHPWNDVVPQAIAKIHEGYNVHQQFNCEHCGVKQTMGTPNVFYECGTCEECGKETDIVKRGCNYMLHIEFR